MILEDVTDEKILDSLADSLGVTTSKNKTWADVSQNHELRKSFYLINKLPSCHVAQWKVLTYDERMAALAIPFRFLEILVDNNKQAKIDICGLAIEREQLVRIFINIAMVALTTDYKNDQIHMRQILKRMR